MKEHFQHQQNNRLEYTDHSNQISQAARVQDSQNYFPKSNQQFIGDTNQLRNSSAKRASETTNRQAQQVQSVNFEDKNQSIYHVPSFLVKLFEIVNNNETREIVTWTREGDGFVIKQPKQFSDQILPQYFKHDNFSSFIRQLNMYDFHKSKIKGSNEQIFKHPFFIEGRKNLLPQIKRKSNSSHPLRAQKKQITENKSQVQMGQQALLSPKNSFDPAIKRNQKQFINSPTKASSQGNKRLSKQVLKQDQHLQQHEQRPGLQLNQQDYSLGQNQLRNRQDGNLNGLSQHMPSLQSNNQQEFVQIGKQNLMTSTQNRNHQSLQQMQHHGSSNITEPVYQMAYGGLNFQNQMDELQQKSYELSYKRLPNGEVQAVTIQDKLHPGNHTLQNQNGQNYEVGPGGGLKINEPYQQTSFFQLKDSLIPRAGTAPQQTAAVNQSNNCRILYDDSSPKASANKDSHGKKKDKNQQMSAPRFMESSKNQIHQKDDQPISLEVDTQDRYQLKRRISCNLIPEQQKRQRNDKFEFVDSKLQPTKMQQLQQNSGPQPSTTEFAKPTSNLSKQIISQMQTTQKQLGHIGTGESTLKNNGTNEHKLEQYEFFVSESLNNVSFKWQKKPGQMNQRGSQNQMTPIQLSQFKKRPHDNQPNNSSFDLESSKHNDNKAEAEKSKTNRDRDDQAKPNVQPAGAIKYEESESASKVSVRDQIKIMVSEFGNLTQNFEQFIQKQQRIEAKLKDLEREKVKQRVINDQLLYQLMKSEENKQVFEKLMTLIFQFIQDKTIHPNTDDNKPNVNHQQINQTINVNTSLPSQDKIKTQSFQIQVPQKTQIGIPNADARQLSDQLKQLQFANNQSSSLLGASDGNFLQQNVLDGMVSQLRMIKSSIYNEQADNSQHQQMIDNLLKQTEQMIPNLQNQQSEQQKLLNQNNHLLQLQQLQQQIQTGIEIQKNALNIDQLKNQQSKQDCLESSDHNKSLGLPKRHMTALTNMHSSDLTRQVGYPNISNLAHSQEIAMQKQPSSIDEKLQMDKQIQPVVQLHQSIPIQSNLATIQVGIPKLVHQKDQSPQRQTSNMQFKPIQEQEANDDRLASAKPQQPNQPVDQNQKSKGLDQSNDQQLRAPAVATNLQVTNQQNQLNRPQNNQAQQKIVSQATPTNGAALNAHQIDTASQMLESKFDGQNQTLMKPSSTNLLNIMQGSLQNIRRASIVQPQFQNVPYQFRRASVVQTHPAGSAANNLRRGSIINNPLIIQTANQLRRASFVQNNISNLPDLVRRASIVQNQLVNMPDNLRRASIIQIQPTKNDIAVSNLNVNNLSGQTTPIIQTVRPSNANEQVVTQSNSATLKPNTQFNQYVMTQVADKQPSGSLQQTIQPSSNQQTIQAIKGHREVLPNGLMNRSMSISYASTNQQQIQKPQQILEVAPGSAPLANSYQIKSKMQSGNPLVDKFGNMQKYFDKGDTTLMNFTENQQKQLIQQAIQQQSQQPNPQQAQMPPQKIQMVNYGQGKSQMQQQPYQAQGQPGQSGLQSYTLRQQMQPPASQQQSSQQKSPQ